MDIATSPVIPKAWIVTRIDSALIGATSCVLFLWPADASAAEHIRNPKVGVLYVYSARLADVDVKAQTITVRGVVDTRERLTLSVQPSTKLVRAGRLVPLANGRIGEAISGTLIINPEKRVVAVATTFGAPRASKAPHPTRLIEVNGIASAWHVRNPLRGNVTTSVIAMPTTR